MNKIDAFIAKLIKKQQDTCFDGGLILAAAALVVAGIAFAVEYIF